MQQVTKGDTIQVHYHGTLTNGEVFDSSTGRAPLEFEVGSGMVIPGFDNGVLGMQVGMALTMNNGQGQQFQVNVVEVKEEVVVLDANHPLAGQDLTFDLELVSIDTPSKIITEF